MQSLNLIQETYFLRFQWKLKTNMNPVWRNQEEKHLHVSIVFTCSIILEQNRKKRIEYMEGSFWTWTTAVGFIFDLNSFF